ncbi:sacsin N-terminal ATP-binding-like domain-containing protein [Hoyosella rhizosphaerae]|uniref:ATP-binding protein n=1 Tax=Hoyosella rhizosphaerae TaxID=1755582 RepID=A0A916XAJ8_9ACTN|nr:ATP-binding protein [Hoyosella rhizosphaerae]GGC56481.1 hypothetical protein GCM10011410_06220 [Hoyosella rhizosphaerae]
MAHADFFNTADLRRRVLAAWADAPARFREDSNAEEDFALSSYRDRIVVELAQNAADAAHHGDGRLLLRLDGQVFTAYNTGIPLNADGVEALSTLRASAKRGHARSAGRFGVGFSAVASVSDDIVVTSHGHAVQFSQDRAHDAVVAMLADEPQSALADELHRRGGHVPMLRLPFPTTPRDTLDYDTAVCLLLRSSRDRDRVANLLHATGETLLVALEGLSEVIIEIDGTRWVLTRSDSTSEFDFSTAVDGAETRWRVVRRTGAFDAAVLADRPREERERSNWTVMWAVPVTATGRVATLPPDVENVVYAPTPSDTALSVPAVLLGTFPLSSDRRTIIPGAATQQLITSAAEAYCDLVMRFDDITVLQLIPGAGLSSSALDSHLRDALDSLLPYTPFLPTHDGRRVCPVDALILDTGTDASPLAEVLAPLVSGLLPGSWSPRLPALRALSVRHLGLADVADILAGRENNPHWWSSVYKAVRASLGPGADVGELGALPVPLLDGRLVQGARSVLVPSEDWGVDPESFASLGLRVVHPDAADPLLELLGAQRATASNVLTHPLTEAAVRNSLNADDPEATADAVLSLVSASGITAMDVPWLAELALRDDEDDYSAAGELLIPGGPLLDLLGADSAYFVVHESIYEKYGADALRAVGALWSFTTLRAADVELGAGIEDEFGREIDRLDDWVTHTAERLGHPHIPPLIPELAVVADLDLVADDQWPKAIELLAHADVRDAIVNPARLLTASGSAIDVPSYTAWWMASHARIDGARPRDLRSPDADEALHGLYDEVTTPMDPAFASALGIRHSLADVLADPDGPQDLMDRLADPNRDVTRAALHAVWTSLADLAPDRINAPNDVRALDRGRVVVVDADDVLILDRPDALPLVEDQPLILLPPHLAVGLADLLDIALVSEEVGGVVTSRGESRPVPEVVAPFLGSHPITYRHHEPLIVDGRELPWWVADGEIHAATMDGLARGLCWSMGQWPKRHLIAAVLSDPTNAPTLLAEVELD